MNIKVNDVNLYYEEYGEGKPIILIHGNSESIDIFDKLIPELSKEYKVYAIDMRCHGKSEKTKEISYDLLSEDIVAFIHELNIQKPIIYGFSDGGIEALLIAYRYPELLSRIIISGANINPEGLNKKDYFMCKLMYFFTRDKKIKMMLKEPNITAEDLNKIIIPVNILAGEYDAILEEHTRLIHKWIKTSTLYIVPREDHGSYIIHSDKIYKILKQYI